MYHRSYVLTATRKTDGKVVNLGRFQTSVEARAHSERKADRYSKFVVTANFDLCEGHEACC